MLGFTFLPTQRVLVKLIKGENRDLIKSIVKSVCVEEACRSYITYNAALSKFVVTFENSNFYQVQRMVNIIDINRYKYMFMKNDMTGLKVLIKVHHGL